MWKKYILVFNLVMIFVNSMETGNKSDLINQQVGVEKNFKGSAPQGEEAEEEEEDEGPSFGGLLNGLLESFSNPKPHPPSPHPPQNSTTPQKPHPPQNPCPGRCVSPLASVFMCDKTTELFSCQGNQVCCHDDPPTAHPSDTKKITPSEILDDDDEEEEEQESVESVKLCDGVCIGKELAGEVCEEVREDGGACPKGSVCCGRSLNSTMATGTPTEKIKKKCEGTCRSMIFGLFLCDEIDSEAECGESHQACCVMKERPQQARPPQGVGHPQGAHPQNRPHPPQGARPTTQPHPQPQESEEDSPPPTQPRPPPSAPQSPSHPPPRPHQPHPQQPHPPPPPNPPHPHPPCATPTASPWQPSPTAAPPSPEPAGSTRAAVVTICSPSSAPLPRQPPPRPRPPPQNRITTPWKRPRRRWLPWKRVLGSV
ncbi:hypothetical protein Fcan01_09709 [Folsomia candida]|uniref:Protein masquerade clip-domain domain-containing protein n=1 Tax=Folsomia candida TaxID=158441 RepID=A0A226EE83_FOLCA|nr:hypothetical protein Fcan01_09709 [Folsomia candida]